MNPMITLTDVKEENLQLLSTRKKTNPNPTQNAKYTTNSHSILCSLQHVAIIQAINTKLSNFWMESHWPYRIRLSELDSLSRKNKRGKILISFF